MHHKRITIIAVGLVVLAGWYFMPSHAQTLEEAQRHEQSTAAQVTTTVDEYRRDLRTVLNSTPAPDAETAAQSFLVDSKKLHDLRTVWQDDVARVEQLGTEQFGKWKTVITSIKTIAARLPEEENYTRNYHDFLAGLTASRAALQQLTDTLDKGSDVTYCIQSRRYDQETRAFIDDLHTVTRTVREHADQYLQSCDTLVELLQQRNQLAQNR